MENKKESAFPLPQYATENGRSGMTLRDYFANSAMQGIISNYKEIDRISKTSPNVNKEIAEISYNISDAMLKQRKQ